MVAERSMTKLLGLLLKLSPGHNNVMVTFWIGNHDGQFSESEFVPAPKPRVTLKLFPATNVPSPVIAKLLAPPVNLNPATVNTALRPGSEVVPPKLMRSLVGPAVGSMKTFTAVKTSEMLAVTESVMSI